MNKNDERTQELYAENVFEKSEYIIPIYQRNYAWGETEICQLLDDINDADGTYYIGSLIVDRKDTNTFEVIDGQQRLTTLFLLLAFLGSKTPDQNALRFEAREKSNRTLKEIKLDFQGGEFYSDEIISGFKIIENYFCKTDKEVFKKKLKEIKLIRTQVPDNIDLNHYFEIMNTRGEQLELHEIVKGKMLRTLSNENADKKICEICAEIWDACSRMDRYVQMNFNKKHRELFFGTDWTEMKINSVDALFKLSELNDSNAHEVKTLREIIRDSHNSNNDNKKQDDLEENERFESIISFPVFLLQVNAAIKGSDNEDERLLDDKRLIEDLKEHWNDSRSVLNFIFALLKYRYFFDKYIIKREYAKDYKEDGKWSLKQLKKYTQRKSEKANYIITYGNAEDETSESNDKIKMLQSCLRVTYTSPKTMHWIHKLLKELYSDEKTDQVALLEKYASGKVRDAKPKEKSGFGFERIVFTYLDYLLWRDHRSEYKDFQFLYRTSIEHFYPQNLINGNNEDRWDDKYLNCFGNLALLTVSANSKFSNLPPASKLEAYKDVVKQSPKLQLMQKSLEENKKVWSKELAYEHGEKMIGYIQSEIEKYHE